MKNDKYDQSTMIVIWVRARSGFWLQGQPTMKHLKAFMTVWPEHVCVRAFEDVVPEDK